MKKGQDYNIYGNCLGFFLAFLMFSLTECSEVEEKLQLKSCDTITLPFTNNQVWSVYYHPYFKRTVLSFIQESPLTIVLIDPETLKYITFPLEKVNSSFAYLSHPLSFYVIDSNTAIVNFLNMKDQFFKIGRNGSILSIIPVVDKRLYKDYELYNYPSLIPFPNQPSGDTIILAEDFTADFPGSQLYITDKLVRNKKFSAKTNLKMKFVDSLMVVSDEIGSYPRELINSVDYYYYEPYFCISGNNEIINLYPSINILGCTSCNLKTEFHNIKIANAKSVTPFNVKSEMDYYYINKYTYENSIMLYIYSDLKDNCYYAISTIQSQYINKDGSKNETSSSPWALVTLDRAFQIKRTDYFDKDDLSKHNFFFSTKYFYILSNSLTKKNSENHLTFIKIKKP